MVSQGCKYWFGPRAVLAMQTVAAGRVKVRELDPSEPTGMGGPLWVSVEALAAAPMRYYGGEARPGAPGSDATERAARICEEMREKSNNSLFRSALAIAATNIRQGVA